MVKADKKNAKIIKPMLGGRDLKKYSYHWDAKWILYMHSKIKQSDYPELTDHLRKHKSKLKARLGGANSRGEVPYEWWQLQVDYYNSGAYKNFDKPKIIWGEIADTAKFAYDDQGYFPEATTFIMTGANLKYLLSIFNSTASLWYFNIISTTTGMGTNRWKKYKIEQLPIPRSPIDNPTLQKPLITLVDKILAAKGKDPLADTSKWEAEIDARVFHLYGLTEEEMLTVLNSFPKMSIVEKTQIQNFYRDLERGNLK